jgi:hypothetical protein
MTAWWAASFDPSCLHHPVWPFRTFFGDCRERPAIGGYFSSVFLNCPVSALQIQALRLSSANSRSLAACRGSGPKA